MRLWSAACNLKCSAQNARGNDSSIVCPTKMTTPWSCFEGQEPGYQEDADCKIAKLPLSFYPVCPPSFINSACTIGLRRSAMADSIHNAGVRLPVFRPTGGRRVCLLKMRPAESTGNHGESWNRFDGFRPALLESEELAPCRDEMIHSADSDGNSNNKNNNSGSNSNSFSVQCTVYNAQCSLSNVQSNQSQFQIPTM